MNFLSAANAFLWHGDRLLLMKRASHKRIWPDKFAGVGGKIEAGENPIDACYREIEEETGLDRTSITSLKLLYITIRQTDGELRQNYHFFGTTNSADVVNTDEGQLMWLDEREIDNLDFVITAKTVLDHYLSKNRINKILYVATSEIKDGRLRMNFAKCEDFG